MEAASKKDRIDKMTYRDSINAEMSDLAKDPDVVVVGYNVCDAGGAGGGSFKCFPTDRRIEMPLAENLLCGAAIGLSLQGYTPLIWLERADFLLCGLDSIVNHLDKLEKLSEGIHRPACIIRVVIGNSKTPLYTGPTHSSDYTDALREMVSFPVHRLTHKSMIQTRYQGALLRARRDRVSTALFELKDCYGE